MQAINLICKPELEIHYSPTGQKIARLLSTEANTLFSLRTDSHSLLCVSWWSGLPNRTNPLRVLGFTFVEPHDFCRHFKALRSFKKLDFDSSRIQPLTNATFGGCWPNNRNQIFIGTLIVSSEISDRENRSQPSWQSILKRQ